MKIRTGFVSNSSSSSYVIVGGTLHFSEELFTLFNLSYLEDDGPDYEVIEQLEELLTEFYKPLGMVAVNAYNEHFLIGYNLEDSANYDKTINQMKSEGRALIGSIPAELRPSNMDMMVGEISN